MNTIVAELRERYGTMATEEVLALRARGASLTDIAIEALDLELRSRGVDEAAVAADESARSAASASRAAEIPNLAPLSSRFIAYVVDVIGDHGGAGRH